MADEPTIADLLAKMDSDRARLVAALEAVIELSRRRYVSGDAIREAIRRNLQK